MEDFATKQRRKQQEQGLVARIARAQAEAEDAKNAAFIAQPPIDPDEIDRQNNLQMFMSFELPTIRQKLNQHDKFVFSIADLQDKTNDMISDMEMLKEWLREKEASGGIGGGGGRDLDGAGMVYVEANQIGWRYDKESLGWYKANGDKLWVYDGSFVIMIHTIP